MTHQQDPPPLDELLERAHIVAIPTRTRFRGVTLREAVVFSGPNGASEFSPFVEYDDPEAAHWLAAAIEFGWGETPEPLRERIPVNATVPAVPANEVAAVLARFPGCRTVKVKVAERGQSLADDLVRVRAVRDALDDADAGRTSAASAANTSNATNETTTSSAAGSAHERRGRIRVDANGGWSRDEAEHALRAICAIDPELEYAEQPCRTVPELAELRRRLDGLVRIAADESVRKAQDPLAVARAGAADLLVVKAQPLGGIIPALAIVREAGLPVVVSSALDTSVGIAMGLHLAAALPEGTLAGACGLGTVALLAGDTVRESLLPGIGPGSGKGIGPGSGKGIGKGDNAEGAPGRGTGRSPVGRTGAQPHGHPGEIPVLRPELDPELLARFRAPRERETWWRDRIARCRRLLSP